MTQAIECMDVDPSLACRLERAEGLANAEFVSARAVATPALRAEWIEVAGAYAMYDGVDSPCTQTFGLGMFDRVLPEHLDRIENFFRQHGAAVAHEICPLTDVALAVQLCERQYRPIEYSNVLVRALESTRRSAPLFGEDVSARRIIPGEERLWADTAARGWRDVATGLDEYMSTLEPIISLRPNSHCFVAEIKGRCVAAGALSLFEQVAILCGACTIPEWRRRGAQHALLAERLRFAAEYGCTQAMIVTRPASASQRNAERHGFRVAYTRTKWFRP